MRFLVIGSEGIALRRVRLLSAMGHTVDCANLTDLRSRTWWSRHVSSIARLRFAWSGATDPDNYDATFICTPLYTRVPLALECLRFGLRSLFIEAPLAGEFEGINELQYASHSSLVMISCPLRFALPLPRYAWSLLELRSSRPRSTPRTGALLAGGRGLSAEVAFPEMDLAYAINGRVERLNCISTEQMVRIAIEHENSAHTSIEVDAAAWYGRRRLAVITAYDDGSSICVPHEPVCFKVLPTDQMHVDEMVHFISCLRSQEPPCNTVSDAAYVLRLTLQTGALGRQTAALDE